MLALVVALLLSCQGGDHDDTTDDDDGADDDSHDSPLADLDVWFAGEQDGDMAGYNVASGGDMNGDGTDDLAVAAIGHDGGGNMAGKVHLVLGRSDGWFHDLQQGDAFVIGGQHEQLGLSLSMAGDVDDDGLSDLLVGSPLNSAAGEHSGRTYLVCGRDVVPGSEEPVVITAAIDGEQAGDLSGYPAILSGDIDGDELDDLLIGASAHDGAGEDAGCLAWIRGRMSGWPYDLSAADQRVVGEAAGDRFGGSLASGHDVDGDDYDDVVVGAWGSAQEGTETGRVYVFASVAGELPASAAEAFLTIDGEQAGDRAGWSLALIGDADGDGLTDLAIGAPGASPAGTAEGIVYLLTGGVDSWPEKLAAAPVRFAGGDSSEGAGMALAVADLNGDSLDDLAVGAPGASSLWPIPGRVSVVLGRESNWPTHLAAGDWIAEGIGDADAAGWALDAGDLTADGATDLLIGAPGNSDGGLQRGMVYVVDWE